MTSSPDGVIVIFATLRGAEADPAKRYNRQACRFQRPQQQARRPALHGVQPDVALREGAEVGDRNELPSLEPLATNGTNAT